MKREQEKGGKSRREGWREKERGKDTIRKKRRGQ